MLNDSAEKKTKTKKVCWDEQKLAEQALEKQLHPKMKINEPKTPFTEIADDETEDYLIKLKEVREIKPSVSILLVIFLGRHTCKCN